MSKAVLRHVSIRTDDLAFDHVTVAVWKLYTATSSTHGVIICDLLLCVEAFQQIKCWTTARVKPIVRKIFLV